MSRDSFVQMILGKLARLESKIGQSPVMTGLVVEVDLDRTDDMGSPTPVRVQLGADPSATLWPPVNNVGVAPQVGETVDLVMNGTDARLQMRPGTLIDGGLFSSNFPGFDQGGPGWGIDHEGNSEFNDVTVRGDLTFQPDALLFSDFASTVDPWTNDGAANVTVELETSPPGGGSVALVWKSTADGSAPMAHPAVPVEAGRTYRLTASIFPWAFSFNIVTHNPGILMRMRWLDDEGATVSETTHAPALPFGAWTDRVAFSAIAPEGAVDVVALIVATNNANGNPAAYVDNVDVIEVSRVVRGHLEDCTGSSLWLDDALAVGGQIVGPRTGTALTRFTDQNILNTATYTISWEGVLLENPDGWWTSGTDLVVPPGMNGVYAITAVADMTGFSDFDMIVNFTTKTSGAPLQYRIRPNGTPLSFFVSVVTALAAGDTFNVQLLNLSGGTRTLTTAKVEVYRLVSG